jgi:uncharacterized SAM-binding protein YcdF (DUF218 family)
MKISTNTFFIKKQRWGFTNFGFITFLIIFTTITFVFFRNLNDFLAVCDQVNAEILIVEGWVPDYVIESAVDYFIKRKSELIVSVGGPFQTGTELYEYENLAKFTYYRIVKAGVEESKIVAIEMNDIKKDRTYQSALAFRDWANKNGIIYNRIQIYTLGTHARRSRLLFQKALGENVKVGVIGVPDKSYDSNSWWKYSNGFRSVCGETIAYLYTVTFFFVFEK